MASKPSRVAGSCTRLEADTTVGAIATAPDLVRIRKLIGILLANRRIPFT
jgi:hypothetical protein